MNGKRHAASNTGHYEVRRFPVFRIPTLDTLDLGMKKHHIPFLLEADVTEARKRIRERKARTGAGLSFTGWVVTCIGQAVSEHKHVHAMRKGRKHLVLFDEVDVSVVVERSVGNREHPTGTLPMPCVVRRPSKTFTTKYERLKRCHSERAKSRSAHVVISG